MPELVPTEQLDSALALRSVAFQIADVSGPGAPAGCSSPSSPEAVYGAGTGLFVALLVVLLLRVTRPERSARDSRPPGLRSVLLGIRFIRDTTIILGAISLDLFAVLFGGSVALLPLFARSILHTGPIGLGVLRSATAVGALVAGIQLARSRSAGRSGRKLLLVVGAFGVCMVVFGLSRWFPLSFAALAVSGYVDMFSMNIRSTVVALATPNALLGRVNAVEGVFISASNELGAFESGLAAALIGAVPAVAIGRRDRRSRWRSCGRALPAAGAGRPARGRARPELGRRSSRSAASRASRSSARPRASRPRRTRARGRRRHRHAGADAARSRKAAPAGGSTRPPSRYGFSTVFTSIASP